jgi:hypothetical protein
MVGGSQLYFPMGAVCYKRFNAVLVQSVKETVVKVLGEYAAKSVFLYLETYYDITLDEVPYRLPTFFSTLKELFGTSGDIIGRAIAQRLYVKLSLEFVENQDRGLLEYGEEALKQLNSTI